MARTLADFYRRIAETYPEPLRSALLERAEQLGNEVAA